MAKSLVVGEERMGRRISIFYVLVALLFACKSNAQLPPAPPYPAPDDRYKADLLLVVGHPDDDALIAGYLARATFDEHKRIAAIVCTQGDGGGNEVASEAGAALGQVRVQEARRALESLGITNVWFLGNHDTPGQNVLWSLDRWNHGRTLDEMVRLVRLTRPEVIVTMLPDQVAGENHADHQAAAVIATEAFDLAGNPTAFPEQISAPRDLHGMSNLTEGLRPWQVKKIYYVTDAFENYSQYWNDAKVASPYRANFLNGAGPDYSSAAISPSRHVSYGRIAAEEQVFYMTQEGSLGKDSLAKGDFTEFEYPVRFIFGKSVVKSSVTGDVFQGVQPGVVAFAPVRGYQPENQQGLTLEIGDPWAFYREFWKAHDIEHLSQLLPVPELAVNWGGTLHVPLLLRNATANPEEVSLTVALPKGWSEKSGSARYTVGAGDIYPAQSVIVAPGSGELGWQDITWKAEASGRQIGSVTLRVLVGRGGYLPQ
jgi:LmbE family N-acetylglucosaminyl deacetylase